MEFSTDFASTLSRLIRMRRTTKVLANQNAEIKHPHSECHRMNDLVLNAIADAGHAPFHYDRKVLDIAEPWRFHVIWQDDCRILATRIANWFPDMKPGNKLPAMLNACGALVLVNWIPQYDDDTSEEKKIQANEEHLAATAAAIQNLLLVLTANNLRNYWSSGGFFRSELMFEKLNIDKCERLLGAIFIDYGANESSVQHISGKNLSKRSNFRDWTNEINLQI